MLGTRCSSAIYLLQALVPVFVHVMCAPAPEEETPLGGVFDKTLTQYELTRKRNLVECSRKVPEQLLLEVL